MAERHSTEDIASESSLEVGQFWYYFDDDRWVWSDELARLHGYACARAITPTTALLLQHKHPDDKARVEALISSVRNAREPFSSQHRIVDLDGTVRPVAVVADTVLDDAGQRIGTSGFYVVLQEPSTLGKSAGTVAREMRQSVTERVDELIDHRATIEQAKGALRLVYHLTEEQAFDLLTWRSQETNTKIRDLAATICEQLDTIDLTTQTRTQFDHLLLSAHEALPRSPAPAD
ncbi:hypothetical protein GOEFS_110_00540 [Gordonia effusa NBRC 100432]|uniref:ANTAR domain-containing protein n=1 Tax=Gordonia effusa NBRC 100432 TaxID=1077974 RepID=H0R5H4_9ACTN|nr:PAS and ANTAR domain-containing protein [Gordonia effusa]GAB20325.1 hypothetical protein GOEFS_110_00540 [Gordonia effusa NBRC 100432]